MAARDATLATNLLGPIPTEQVMCCSSAMVARSRSPIATAEPCIRSAPVTSMNASSTDADSTTALNELNTSTIALETAT